MIISSFSVKNSVCKPVKYKAYCLSHFGVGVIVAPFGHSRTRSILVVIILFGNIFLSRIFQKSSFKNQRFLKILEFRSTIKTCDKFPICEIVRYEDLVLRPNEILPKLIESYRYQKLYIPPRFKFSVSWANKSVTSWNRTLPEGIDQVRHRDESSQLRVESKLDGLEPN